MLALGPYGLLKTLTLGLRQRAANRATWAWRAVRHASEIHKRRRCAPWSSQRQLRVALSMNAHDALVDAGAGHSAFAQLARRIVEGEIRRAHRRIL